jgi:hypothetical protein
MSFLWVLENSDSSNPWYDPTEMLYHCDSDTENTTTAPPAANLKPVFGCVYAFMTRNEPNIVEIGLNEHETIADILDDINSGRIEGEEYFLAACLRSFNCRDTKKWLRRRLCELGRWVSGDKFMLDSDSVYSLFLHLQFYISRNGLFLLQNAFIPLPLAASLKPAPVHLQNPQSAAV